MTPQPAAATEWVNWSGGVRCAPRLVATPRNEAEVASLVITGDAEVGITVEHAANDVLQSVALGQQEMLVVTGEAHVYLRPLDAGPRL